jgi:hypothetical protein
MAADENKFPGDLVEFIKGLHGEIAAFLPLLETSVNAIIERRPTDKTGIEHLLDTLLSMMPAGQGHASFIRLLEYYKTVDQQGADFYWALYEDMNI